MELELTSCPWCGCPAEVIDRFVVFERRGPIEHLVVRCVTGAVSERPIGPWCPGAPPGPRGDA